MKKELKFAPYEMLPMAKVAPIKLRPHICRGCDMSRKPHLFTIFNRYNIPYKKSRFCFSCRHDFDEQQVINEICKPKTLYMKFINENPCVFCNEENDEFRVVFNPSMRCVINAKLMYKGFSFVTHRNAHVPCFIEHFGYLCGEKPMLYDVCNSPWLRIRDKDVY